MKQILKFKAVWCGPCKSLTNLLEGVDLGMPVTEIDIDQDFETAVQYNIRNVPTMVVIEDGKEVKRLSGLHSLDQIKHWAGV